MITAFPRVRLTVRGTMVAVAAVALALGIVEWAKETRRRVNNRRHHAAPNTSSVRAFLIPGRDMDLRPSPETEYRAKMARKWLDA